MGSTCSVKRMGVRGASVLCTVLPAAGGLGLALGFWLGRLPPKPARTWASNVCGFSPEGAEAASAAGTVAAAGVCCAAAPGFTPSTGLAMAPGNGFCTTQAAKPSSRSIFCRCNSCSTIMCCRCVHQLLKRESIAQTRPWRRLLARHKNAHSHTQYRPRYPLNRRCHIVRFAPTLPVLPTQQNQANASAVGCESPPKWQTLTNHKAALKGPHNNQ